MSSVMGRVFWLFVLLLALSLTAPLAQASVVSGVSTVGLTELQSKAITPSAEDTALMHQVRRIVNKELAVTALEAYQEYVQSGCARRLAEENRMLLTGYHELQVLYQQVSTSYTGSVSGFAAVSSCVLIMHFDADMTPVQKCTVTAHEVTHLVLRDKVPNPDPEDPVHSLNPGDLMFGKPRSWSDFVASYPPCLTVEQQLQSEQSRQLVDREILRRTLHERGMKLKACRTAAEDGLASADLYYCLSRDDKVLRIRILSNDVYDGDPMKVGVKQFIRGRIMWDNNRKNGGKLVRDPSRTAKARR